MSMFNNILTGAEEDLVKIFYNFRTKDDSEDNKNNLILAAKKFKLHPHQLVFALGFTAQIAHTHHGGRQREHV